MMSLITKKQANDLTSIQKMLSQISKNVEPNFLCRQVTVLTPITPFLERKAQQNSRWQRHLCPHLSRPPPTSKPGELWLEHKPDCPLKQRSVSDLKSASLGLAPASSNRSTMAKCPCCAARCKQELPVLYPTPSSDTLASVSTSYPANAG